MGDLLPTLRVAAIQAAPVFLDREATTDKAVQLIREAGEGGAKLVGFPEGFIPGHPLWYHFLSASSARSRQLATQLFLNSVEVPSPTTDRLCQAARAAGVYVVMGFCERLPGRTGTMYNSQLFLSPRGEIIGKRQKIMPTGGEPLVHTLGSGEGLRPVETEFGPVSGLICGENSNPLAVFALQAMGSRIHVASWPSHFSETQPMLDAIEISTRALAYQSGVFVINAVGLVNDEMIDLLAATEEDRRFLKRRQQESGGYKRRVAVVYHIDAKPVRQRGRLDRGKAERLRRAGRRHLGHEMHAGRHCRLLLRPGRRLLPGVALRRRGARRGGEQRGKGRGCDQASYRANAHH